MTTCSELTIEWCRRCKREGMHARGVCIHCRTEYRYAPVRDFGPERGEGSVFKEHTHWPHPRVRRGGRRRVNGCGDD